MAQVSSHFMKSRTNVIRRIKLYTGTVDRLMELPGRTDYLINRLLGFRLLVILNF